MRFGQPPGPRGGLLRRPLMALMFLLVALGPRAASARPGAPDDNPPLGSVTGMAFVRTDDHDRIVVVIDADPADGTADLVYVFEPITPLRPGLSPRTLRVQATVTDGGVVVQGLDDPLYLDLGVSPLPVDPRSATIRQGSSIHALGHALVTRRSDSWSDGPDRLDTDSIPTISRGDELDPLDIYCANGVVGKDTDCQAGGVGASSATKTCAGFGMIKGEAGTATCGAGFYACAYCTGPIAFATCRSTTCTCPPGQTSCIIR